MIYELKLRNGSVVEWEGDDPESAARRYVDAHRSAVVVAVRERPWGVRVLGRSGRFIEP